MPMFIKIVLFFVVLGTASDVLAQREFLASDGTKLVVAIPEEEENTVFMTEGKPKLRLEVVLSISGMLLMAIATVLMRLGFTTLTIFTTFGTVAVAVAAAAFTTFGTVAAAAAFVAAAGKKTFYTSAVVYEILMAVVLYYSI